MKTVRRPRALVLTPLRDSALPVQKTIERALQKAQVDPVLLDFSSRSAITAILQKSDIVVADVSDKNPNVLYELGYAHALGKPTVLLVNTESADGIPADLAGFHIIAYDSSSLDSLAHRISRIVNALTERIKVVP